VVFSSLVDEEANSNDDRQPFWLVVGGLPGDEGAACAFFGM
jgi:hypothetical protein